MRFDRIRLSNFKPYGDADLTLTDGVTVIHGLNGSGKSSLLEACFFALYGSKALEGTLEDVVSNGESETTVELRFTHDGTTYRIERRLKTYADRVDHQCTLAGVDAPDITRDGATAVRQFITELLRMDAEAFVNCAYVRQGEVNKLINATPSQRQDTIDELLQLGTLERYRVRAGDARLGVEDVRNAKRAVVSDVTDRIERLEDKGLHDRLNGLESELSELEDRIDHFEDQRETAKRTREGAVDTLEAYEEQRDAFRSVVETIEQIETAIRETERERDELGSSIRDANDRIEDLRETVDDGLDDAGVEAPTLDAIERRREELAERRDAVRTELDDHRVTAEGFRNQARNLAEKATELTRRADELDAEADELDAEADELDAEIAARESTLEELHAEAETIQERFSDATVERDAVDARLADCRESRNETRVTRAELEAELENVRERVSEAEELLESGNCPTCGQPVEDSPHAHRIEPARERVREVSASIEEVRERETALDDRVETLETLANAADRLSEIESTVSMIEERVADERTEAVAKRESASEKRESASENREESVEIRAVADEKRDQAEETAERVSELETQLEAVAAVEERVGIIEDHIETIDGIEDRIDRHRERRENLSAVNDERRERLAEKRERRDELSEAVEEASVETARKRKQEADAYLERVADELDGLDERRTELQNAIGGVTGEIAQLESLRRDHEELSRTVELIESLHEETTALEAMYGDLRAELRRRNISELERMVNETFDLVYGNDAYSHIELDGDYALSIYQKDGEALDPEQLSGGERALFNLSLRCAIYRLLAEGIEGSAPTPPLILDEPTVFLDSGHVSRLVSLVEEMRGFGVPQIIIVSHDDELVGAADELVTVEKDPRTNRSTVTRENVVGHDLLSGTIE